MKKEPHLSPEMRQYDEIESAIEAKNADSFISAWQDTNSEIRNEIAESLFRVDEEFGLELYEKLSQRYSKVNQGEQANIITVFGSMGGQASEVEKETANFLLSLVKSEEAPQLELIEALRQKAFYAHIEKDSPKNQKKWELENLEKIINQLQEVASDSTLETKIRVRAIYGISRYSKETSKSQDLKNTLEELVNDQDEKVADQALEELIGLSQPGDELTTEKLLEKCDGLDLHQLDQEEKTKLLRQMGDVFMPNNIEKVEEVPANNDQIIEIEKKGTIEKINERREKNE